jgi:hypothetical protein
MPRQWFLNKLDPDGSLTVPELRMILEVSIPIFSAVLPPFSAKLAFIFRKPECAHFGPFISHTIPL